MVDLSFKFRESTEGEILEAQVLFFLILGHFLKDVVNVYDLFCELAKN